MREKLMPTKDSSILSLRIRNPIIEHAKDIAKREGFKSLHSWVICVIEAQLLWDYHVKSKGKKEDKGSERAGNQSLG
jgi:hypothetical protein